MNTSSRDSVRILLTLLVTVVACVSATPPVSAQQHSPTSYEVATSNSVAAIEQSNSGATAPSLSTQTETIRINIIDSSNGQDNATVGVSVNASTPGTTPSAVSDTVSSTQWSTVVGDDNEAQATEISAALRSWADTRSYDGVGYEATDLSAIIRYWSNTQ